ncbi:MerR family DNA-binding protein [Marinobacter sp. NSM]|uniref:MerR family DNA-binding protein n=1 Tax=Marinobacter sp. NSM TaxID=3458004 RepID=UPI004036AE96
MPLTEVGDALAALPTDRTVTADDWKHLSELWRADLDRRIDMLTGLRDQLSDCIGCGCLSIDACRLRNPWDELGERGPGARLLEPDAE